MSYGGPRVVKNDFVAKLSVEHLWCSNKWFHFKPSLIHISPCKFPKGPEMGSWH